MAFAFGDPYLKLPPIKKEELVETSSDDDERPQANRGLHRDKHGLIRLPPIVRLDSLHPAANAKNFSSTNEPQFVTKQSSLWAEANKIESEPEKLGRGSSIGSAKKTSPENIDEAFTQESTKRDRKYNSLDEVQSVRDTDVKTTTGDKRYFDVEGDSSDAKENSTFCRAELQGKSGTPLLSIDQGSMPLCDEERMSRRGSTSFVSLRRLKRSSRLAKSSPELSFRRINKLRTEGNVAQNSEVTSVLSPTRGQRNNAEPRLSIHDIDSSVLANLHKPGIITREKIQESRRERFRIQKGSYRRLKDDTSDHQPQSLPSSPVCSEPAVIKKKERKGRKSLNDITDIGQFVEGRRASISAPQKQNLMREPPEGLQVLGRSCPQNERETQRARTPRGHHAESPVPHGSMHNDKRASLHDLQQILSILQKEDFKRPTVNSPPRSQDLVGKTADASVYDLREFLMLAKAAEASGGKPTPSKLAAANKTCHLSPKPEGEGDSTRRKGSVYDLMEFLSLGSGGNSAATSQNTSRAASPRILVPAPNSVGDSNGLLSTGEQNRDPRRSSTYDLLEFLSLPKAAGNSRPELATRQSQSGDAGLLENRLGGQDNPAAQTRSVGKDNRSLSVYDLADFLTMTSGVPPLVRVTGSDDQQAGRPTEVLEPGGVEKLGSFKRDSVYDLGEILNVMQQEHDSHSAGQNLAAPSATSRKGSMYNLQEILSHFQLEAEDTNSAITPESPGSVERGTVASQSPPMTASSGYSTSSNSSSAEVTSSDTSDNKRHMSVYDLREFLSMYASAQQQNPPNLPVVNPSFSRKSSGLSESGVSIQVTDENNRSLDHDFANDEVFQPAAPEMPEDKSQLKRSSVYDLREFLTLLNDDESPLRRRLSSISSVGSSEGETLPLLNSIMRVSESDNLSGNEQAGRPQLSPRQDSGGNVSLYDLGEFLSLLNTEESPLRRRLSSTSEVTGSQADMRVRSPALPRGDDSEKGLYNLDEILTALNELELKQNSENTTSEENIQESVGEISIQVPQLPSAHDRATSRRFTTLTKQSSLTRVPETTEVKPRLSL